MKTIKLANGLLSIVDDEFYSEIMAMGSWRWEQSRKSSTPYALYRKQIKGVRNRIYMHRVVWALAGRAPVRVLDHSNRNGLDNRLANLRPATISQNGHNCRNRHGASGYRGVSWSNYKSKWRARINVDGKQLTIGTYDDALEAALAYDAAAHKYHGEFARTNFH